MTRKALIIFALATFITFALFLAANLIAAHFQSDCGLPAILGFSGCADDIRRAGFPLIFWKEGGFAYTVSFEPANLIFDVGLAIVVSIVVGFVTQRLMLQADRTDSA